MQLKTLGAALLCALALAVPAAHHSHGNYDLSKWTNMGGRQAGDPRRSALHRLPGHQERER
jgi:hypothetical protein